MPCQSLKLWGFRFLSGYGAGTGLDECEAEMFGIDVMLPGVEHSHGWHTKALRGFSSWMRSAPVNLNRLDTEFVSYLQHQVIGNHGHEGLT